MNTTITIQTYSDPLMDRYNELAMMNVIPDMLEYAKSWQILALQAQAQDRPALASMCESRAAHYAKVGGGEYIKLVEGCLAELISTSVAWR